MYIKEDKVFIILTCAETPKSANFTSPNEVNKTI